MMEVIGFYNRYKESRGFTLVELLITLVICGLVLTAAYQFFITQNKIYLQEKELAAMEQRLRTAINIIAKDLRKAGYNTNGNNSVGINTTSDNTQIIFSYVNATNDVETITYSLYDSGSDGDMDLGRKESDGNNQPLAKDISNIEFEYCDNENCTYSPDDDVDQVKVTLEASPLRNNIDIDTLNMTTHVFCRNLSIED